MKTKLKIIENDGRKSIVINNSSLEKFTQCPRAYQYYGCNERTKSSASHSLIFGTAIHAGLEARYNALKNGGNPLQASLKGFNDAWNFEAHYDDHRDYNYGIHVLENYDSVWSFYEKEMEIVDIEYPFEKEIFTVKDPETSKDIEVRWRGVIDLIYKKDGKTYLLDHKTTSILTPSYFAQYEINSQINGYIYTIQKATSKPVDFFTINAIGTRKLSKTKPKLKDDDIAIFTTEVNQESVEEWHSNLFAIVSNMVNCSKNEYWPMHTKNCIGKFGKCEFHDVCVENKSNRGIILGSCLYTDVEHNKNTEKLIQKRRQKNEESN